MNLRRAKKEELNKIAKILKEVFNSKPFLDKWTDNSSRKAIKLHHKQNQIFVLKEDKEMIGFIIIRKGISHKGEIIGQITDLAIKKNCQNKRLGSEFLQKIEKLLKKKGYKNLYLETYSKSKAVNFYRKNKYKISKDTVFMTKNL